MEAEPNFILLYSIVIMITQLNVHRIVNIKHSLNSLHFLIS